MANTVNELQQDIEQLDEKIGMHIAKGLFKMMQPTAMEIALDIVGDKYQSLAETGLSKRCPRCARVGTIYRTGDVFMILWDGPARGGSRHGVDVDTTLSFINLIDPVVGCGYDPKF